ncbi:Na+/H+ antiporter subunit A [Diaminobutyricimonas sp. TR449]|uniref:Na+/H+ antiporter subunit A n=1 Tax=Diaminobutyricimonas sp. TR449 TaxID=2708076 RepID=UPI00141F53E7|nr:Na+/H+ antiporter subunit A [Diaminobutyricimonas sp. TR449]
MLILLALFGVVAAVLPAITRFLGTRVFFVAALIPLAAFVHAVLMGPAVLAGGVITETYEWIPQLGLSLAFRMDTLGWLLALIVSGVGTLVLIYCVHYFDDDEDGLGRFAGVLLAFAGAMYGLVTADDVYLLFIFWEATTVFSYLLIGHYTGKTASRGAALKALLVTTFGGLTMLVGLVLLAVETGTTLLSEIIAEAPEGALITTAIILILVGALSKSAIVPFHFWLPSAMAAPTPVSAYLHAAAMVKAGIYLIARLAPGFASTPGWQEILIGTGVITMLVGGYRALRQFDLKLLLAYGTVSQLGFLVVIVGYGVRDTALAGLTLLLAHALFKAALFLIVGVIDHRAGTRDLRKLSGLGADAPAFATIAILALASMAGLPPLIGFVAKEAVFTSLLDEATAGSALAWLALIGVAAGSILTVAYSLRFLWGAFARKPDVPTVRAARRNMPFLVAPAVLAFAGLGFGLAPTAVDGWLDGYADSFPSDGSDYHLALWHGWEPALAISAVTLLSGILLFLARARVQAAQARMPDMLSASEAYWLMMRGIDRSAARVTALTQRGSLPFYLGVILLVFVVSMGFALGRNQTWPDEFVLWDHPLQLGVAIIGIIAAFAATRAQKRFQAVVLVGVTGYGMAALFALQGAPDLALTQALVETVTLVAFVLVLRRLPARLGERHASVRRGLRAVIAIAVGVTMGVIALVASSVRTHDPISLQMPQLAYEGGHGRNVVNVMLVDLRGWDTMGELSVVIVAATGVASLIFLSTRTDNLPRVSRRDAREQVKERLKRVADPADTAYDRAPWLLAGRRLAPQNRSILLEVVVRLLFHPIMIVSLYLLFAGHNAPGGGFSGGLVAGLALVARYLAGGRYELGAAAPLDAGKLLGAGLVLAAGTALVPLFFGADALTSTFFEWDLGVFGHVEFVTSTVFDIGVYLVVIGLILDVLRSLGAEVDRQQEDEVQGASI